MGRSRKKKRGTRSAKAERPTHKMLPDFDLATLTSFPPEALLGGRNSADAFILLLATAYNDFKDENWMIQQLEAHKPAEIRPTPYVGQFQGVRIRATRYVAGIVNELLKGIDAAADAGLLNDAAFLEALNRVGQRARRAWDDLVAVATGQPGTSPS